MTISEKFIRLREIRDLTHKLHKEKEEIEQSLLQDIVKNPSSVIKKEEYPDAYYYIVEETGEQFKLMCYIDVDRKSLEDEEWDSLAF